MNQKLMAQQKANQELHTIMTSQQQIQIMMISQNTLLIGVMALEKKSSQVPLHLEKETATASHAWAEEGDYIITAKAKDINGLVGPEGTLTVTMPRNKVLTNTLFQKILNIFPNEFPMLKQLIQRLGLQ